MYGVLALDADGARQVVLSVNIYAELPLPLPAMPLQIGASPARLEGAEADVFKLVPTRGLQVACIGKRWH